MIQKFGESISDVDWSYIDLGRSGGWWTPRLRVELTHLDSLNASRAALIDAATDPEHLGQLLRRDEHAHACPSDPVESIASQLKLG